MKKLMKLFFLFIIGFTVLTACAPDREPENESASSVSLSDIEKPETLTIWVNDAEDEISALRTISDIYTDNTDIQIEIVPISARDQANAMSLDAPSGRGPDIWFATHNSMGRNILQGLAEPIELNSETIDEFMPEAIQSMTHDGVIYSLPQVIETTALYYNKELIPEAPESWEQLESFSDDFTNPAEDKYGFLFDAKNFYFANMFLEGYGGYIFGYDEETGYNADDIGLNSLGAIEGAKLIQSWFNNGYIPESITGDIMNGLFIDGKVGAVVSGPWSLNEYKDALGDNLGVVALPKLNNGKRPLSFLGVKGWVLSPYSENKEWALDFMLHITSDESLTHHFETALEIPARPGIMDSDLITQDPYFSAFSEQARSATPTPNNPEMSQTWEPMGNALTFIAQGDDVEEVLDEAVEVLKETIDLAAQ